MQDSLKITDLSVQVESKLVVDEISLTVNPGEVHAIMGPNGSGKSSLALALMGHPAYRVVNGQVMMGSSDLLSLKPNERVKKGLFLSFQNPVAVPGVSLGQLAWSSYRSIAGESKVEVRDFYTQLKKQAKSLGLKEEMLNRFVNESFSGGEKKKAEMLLLLNLAPKFVIFDEIDSGLDVDTLKIVAKTINGLVKQRTGVILITHNQKILRYVKPNFVHILKAGKIVRTGGHELASEIEERGYVKI
ncbi:Fe-S cluster assembly ATPase SufC [Candidatus Daviesbacteria bacterium RIFCSPHIGHO2_01_FULL_41_23]|uniref:Fe-S cluster assembly ATPase SufC n=1 Tax=Candidatus Daviesbacteria bacterium RIFCSPHIGHO2_01_FULL_41_23 TaxID=1797764 RepID=A0A1F5ITU6_9BACT|nr:MAG: Fe-S cluster assembly ATPase SufC [Candidatus Daviesbacteria bacterium RIFCSPHIGHO2_01_FULL_41_23]